MNDLFRDKILENVVNELLRGKILQRVDLDQEENKSAKKNSKKDFSIMMPEHVRYFAEGLIDEVRFCFLHDILSEWLEKITKH